MCVHHAARANWAFLEGVCVSWCSDKSMKGGSALYVEHRGPRGQRACDKPWMSQREAREACIYFRAVCHRIALNVHLVVKSDIIIFFINRIIIWHVQHMSHSAAVW